MYNVIVIGGGHAGTEAAAVATRRGARTALLNFGRDQIGAMSCNPAIGGVGKGHIVREVDAFDGLIARAADAAAIHYRMLNRSKGVAVHGPRVQADRRLYKRAIQAMLAAEPLVEIVEGEAVRLLHESGRVTGIVLAGGSVLRAPSVVLATGTFLGARLFRGEERATAGRIGERAAGLLADDLAQLGIAVQRSKTGTPPRLDGRTIDWARLDRQASDQEPWTMSPMTARRVLPQVACAVTHTNARTHALIEGALHRSPMFTGAIESGGPRYCPSIEDKIHRFRERDAHQLFLEPEGLDDATVYPNGLSTSLPAEVQAEVIASIVGLEHARITVPGYAVEYAHINPRQLDHRLALRTMAGLFCAGQINGTTGYEEAAGQGLVAGANAAAHALGLAPLRLNRASSYVGVMIDDLVLQGVSEPYRMLTARAEYRLSLRADNAETRLSPLARELGCLGAARIEHVQRREQRLASLRTGLSEVISGSELQARGGPVNDNERRSGAEWLRHAGVDGAHLGLDEANAEAAEAVADARYAPYLERQADEVAKLRAEEAITFDERLCFGGVPGLSTEMVERLSAARPVNLGEASRVPGVTPAALTALLLHSRRGEDA